MKNQMVWGLALLGVAILFLSFGMAGIGGRNNISDTLLLVGLIAEIIGVAWI